MVKRRKRGGGGRKGPTKAASTPKSPTDNPDLVAAALGGRGDSIEMHPLLNPVILSNLFDKCPAQLLSNCRLVCKTWRDISLPAWRSSATVTLRYDDDEDSPPSIYLGEKYLGKQTTFRQFLNHWERERDSGSPLFKKFCLQQWDFLELSKRTNSRSLSPSSSLMARFGGLIGPSVTFLELRFTLLENLQRFQEVIYGWCPNLQSLVLNGLRVRVWDDRRDFHISSPLLHVKKLHLHFCYHLPLSWYSFFVSLPALTGVRLENMSDKQNKRIFKAIRMMREEDPGRLTSLDSFIVECTQYGLKHSTYLKPAIGRHYVALKLPLEAVTFRLRLWPLYRIREMIILQRGSLRMLSFFKDMDDNRAAPVFPTEFPFGVELNNLEELTMPEEFCGNMEFLRWTPNLKSLCILDTDDRLSWLLHGNVQLYPVEITRMVSNTRRDAMANLKMLKLEEFQLEYVVSTEDLRGLVGWFPALDSLTMVLNDEQFGVVCENWRLLTNLHVIGQELTDGGITGRKIGKDGKIVEGEEEEGSIRPNITFLRGLTAFRMSEHGSTLSDVSAYHGFLKLDYLKTLDIPSNNNRFGVDAVNLLKAKIPECKLATCMCQGCQQILR